MGISPSKMFALLGGAVALSQIGSAQTATTRKRIQDLFSEPSHVSPNSQPCTGETSPEHCYRNAKTTAHYSTTLNTDTTATLLFLRNAATAVALNFYHPKDPIRLIITSTHESAEVFFSLVKPLKQLQGNINNVLECIDARAEMNRVLTTNAQIRTAIGSKGDTDKKKIAQLVWAANHFSSDQYKLSGEKNLDKIANNNPELKEVVTLIETGELTFKNHKTMIIDHAVAAMKFKGYIKLINMVNNGDFTEKEKEEEEEEEQEVFLTAMSRSYAR